MVNRAASHTGLPNKNGSRSDIVIAIATVVAVVLTVLQTCKKPEEKQPVQPVIVNVHPAVPSTQPARDTDAAIKSVSSNQVTLQDTVTNNPRKVETTIPSTTPQPNAVARSTPLKAQIDFTGTYIGTFLFDFPHARVWDATMRVVHNGDSISATLSLKHKEHFQDRSLTGTFYDGDITLVASTPDSQYLPEDYKPCTDMKISLTGTYGALEGKWWGSQCTGGGIDLNRIH